MADKVTEEMRKEAWTLLVTMVIGGLVYSIVTFSYMHTTFTTREMYQVQGTRIDRNESRIDERLKNIEYKLDRLIERGKR